MEGELVRLALLRIEQDPSQFDLFIDMLRDTEGMDLIVTTLAAGELRCSTYTYLKLVLLRALCVCVENS